MFKPSGFGGKIFRAYLNMKNHPLKIRWLNLIGKTFFSNGITLVDEKGLMLVLNPNDWISRIMMREGEYEPDSVQLAKNLMKAGGTFIDIGANFGLYTASICKGNKLIKVIAAEPNFKVIPALLNNIRVNNIESQVSVFNVAITARPAFVTMEQPALNNLGTTQTKTGAIGLLNVVGCTLEHLLKTNGVKELALVKIDIEGNEYSVFEFFDFSTTKIRNIIMEFNNLNQVGFEKLQNFFAAKGFTANDIYGQPLINAINIPENNIWFVNKKWVRAS